MSHKTILTLQEAAAILASELNYPKEKALQFAKRFDKNNDGRLSATEFTAFKQKIDETKTTLVPQFKKYDKDGNGYITLQEAAAVLQTAPYNFPPNKVVFLLKNFDKDGNGKLDIDEFTGFFAEAKAINQQISAKFDQLDRDGNGVLSPGEVIDVIKETMGFDESAAKQMVNMFDQNNDGNLDKGEFMQMWGSMFG